MSRGRGDKPMEYWLYSINGNNRGEGSRGKEWEPVLEFEILASIMGGGERLF